MKVVIVWILGHASVDEGPGEIVDGILLVLDGFGDDLGVEVVVQVVVQMGLDGERLVEELLVEILLAVLTQKNTNAFVVQLRSIGPAQHVEHVCDWVVHVGVHLSIVVLGVNYHHEMGVGCEGPTQTTGCHYDLDKNQILINGTTQGEDSR